MKHKYLAMTEKKKQMPCFSFQEGLGDGAGKSRNNVQKQLKKPNTMNS